MGHGFTFIFPVFEGGDFGIVSAIFLYFNSECYIVYIVSFTNFIVLIFNTRGSSPCFLKGADRNNILL